ncbi:MAG: hypothetical protein Q8M29_02655 [Bacteroidota bacterium]|nr:hypothetical protein [Bacteroidota bacterium]
METTYSATSSAKSATQAKANTTNSWYDKLVAKAESSYFGLIAITISIGSILGGIGAMYIFQNDAPTWQLALCMSFAMANNVVAIGQAPTKWVVNLFAADVLVSLILIAINAF